MTIGQAINTIDSLKPNSYSQEEKIAWLKEADDVVYEEIINCHEGGGDISKPDYKTDTSLDTELIVGSPYSRLYVSWLQAKIDYWNGEYQKYNNSIAMYNLEYQAFNNEYNRTHMPKGEKINYW